MKSLNRHTSCVALLTIGLMISPHGHADDSVLPKKAEPQPQVSQSVQPEVDKKTADAALEKRRQLMKEAQDAIAETERALQALENKNTRDALDALAIATGKLELILARNPKLALAPVRTDIVTHDLLAKNDTVKAAVKKARDLLRDGEIQKRQPK